LDLEKQMDTGRRPLRVKAIKPLAIVLAVLAGGTAVARHLGYKVGGNVVVRCRQSHLFTTIWIPGGLLKGLDLVVARVQRCPVGMH
jgi:hypothetical protein